VRRHRGPALWWGWSCGLAGEEREEAGSLGCARNDNQEGKGNSNSNSNSNSKGSLVEVLLSHVSDDKAVASVGHPGCCGEWAKNGRKRVRSAAPRNDNQKSNGKSGLRRGVSLEQEQATAKAWLVEVLVSHVSDDEAVASVGHPGGCGEWAKNGRKQVRSAAPRNDNQEGNSKGVAG